MFLAKSAKETLYNELLTKWKQNHHFAFPLRLCEIHASTLQAI
jgi:hypothetical protein